MKQLGNTSLLIVEDNPVIIEHYLAALGQAGFQSDVATSAEEALEFATQKIYNGYIIDHQLSGPQTGLWFAERLREKRPLARFVIATANTNVTNAVEAMRLGALDYLQKPISLPKLIDLCMAYFVAETEKNPIISSESQDVLDTYRYANRIAQKDASILIEGPTGSGKELLAKQIHLQSNRTGKFVAVNCPAIPVNLAESILFGHLKGSFTGATIDRAGKFEVAQNGTIFLDEIQDLNLEIQAKLLRVLQEKSVEALGATEPTRLDVRVVAATSKDLFQLASEGSFREDLYYRLSECTLQLPALSERAEDIPGLVEEFCRRYSNETGEALRTFHATAIDDLSKYPWPGNIRQLRSYIRKILIMSDAKTIMPKDLRGKPFQLPEVLQPEPTSVRAVEADHMQKILEQHGGNVAHAAAACGMSRSTFYRKLKNGTLKKTG